MRHISLYKMNQKYRIIVERLAKGTIRILVGMKKIKKNMFSFQFFNSFPREQPDKNKEMKIAD